MPKLVLGDNPFFAISHLAPRKSAEYLESESLFDDAVCIIRKARAIGIDTFMVSTHADTQMLLEAAGYGHTPDLPEICLVVPNVHKVNEQAVSSGVFGAILAQVKNVTKLAFSVKQMYRSLVMADISFPEVRYVALHNVVVDLLIGLRAASVLKVFCALTRWAGYRPVLITLNPMRLLELNVKCAAVCCYHNVLQYNVCSPSEEVTERFRQSRAVDEIWAMGIVASGAVSNEQLARDLCIHKFDRALVASSKLERIEGWRNVLDVG